MVKSVAAEGQGTGMVKVRGERSRALWERKWVRALEKLSGQHWGQLMLEGVDLRGRSLRGHALSSEPSAAQEKA